jgi:neurotransmitter:Na+ symporter, NSS family
MNRPLPSTARITYHSANVGRQGGSHVAETRGQWRTKLGFVLAASGSAIGLGNIVFFGANAYTYGAGAFYLPYLLALMFFGIPVLIAELGLGSYTQKAFPASLHDIGGAKGEFMGWWGLLNSSFITMYYVTILAWVCGMFFGAFGQLWRPSTAVPAFGHPEMGNPFGFFFNMISSWWVLGLVVLVWSLNVLIVRKGVTSIEPVTKVFVPLMWIFMIILIIRGVTLPFGEQGIYLLFTPDFEIMSSPDVWRGAVSQIFFSLSLGFGVMTAYASYLPRNADQTGNSLLVACLNCGFEYIAGIAIFALLFTFAIVPQASTLAMMFFVVPQGINAMPMGVLLFGLMFFLLLLMAGLSSSISLIEGINSALIDKFGWSRRRTIAVTSVIGLSGSMLFALPIVIDRGLDSNGTFGLSFLDLIDHWAFSHGLLIVGLVECLMIGWLLPVSKIRELLNRNSRLRLPAAFDWVVKVVIPLGLAIILVLSIVEKVRSGIYGNTMTLDFLQTLPWIAFILWLGGTTAVAFWLTARKPSERQYVPSEEVDHA